MPCAEPALSTLQGSRDLGRRHHLGLPLGSAHSSAGAQELPLSRLDLCYLMNFGARCG
jgi:hypothetical protein